MEAKLGIWLTAKIAKPQQRDKALAKAEVFSLRENLFDPFNFRAAQVVKFSSDYANVWELTNVLRAASHALAQGQLFDSKLLVRETRIMSVQSFFIDKSGNHIVAALAVTNFKKEAHAFLDLYFAIEKADYGIPNFNQRVLSQLLRSCLGTTRALKEFSYEP